MKEYRKLKLGERVKLDIPFTDRAGSNEIKKFNGHNFEVSNAKRLKLGYIYELKGVRSKMGIPFSFVSDWLVPLEEEIAFAILDDCEERELHFEYTEE